MAFNYSGGAGRTWGAVLSALTWFSFFVYGVIATVILQRGGDTMDEWLVSLTLVIITGSMWLLWVAGDFAWRLFSKTTVDHQNMHADERDHITGGKLDALVLLVVLATMVATYFGIRGYDAAKPVAGSADHNILRNIYLVMAGAGVISVPKIVPAFVYHLFSSDSMRTADAGRTFLVD